MKAEYVLADEVRLRRIWQKNVQRHADDPRWQTWREEYIANHLTGRAQTFLVLLDGEPVGEGTLILSEECSAVRRRTCLCDGRGVGNVNALRIEKPYEGQGHISRMMRQLESHARALGLRELTIGVEARETRNLGIYLHWGYTRFVYSENQDGELVLYYAKPL